jgi:2-polyprenyl-3-methyl-5-hydroxy-6-metoxy-1,4-benzoquinol methylase
MPYQNPPEVCPVCEEKSDFKFIQDYENKGGKWSLYECSKCTVQFWMPFENPGVNHYERKYIVRDTMNPQILYGYHKYFLKIQKNFPKNTRVLDLGCGTCDLLAELKKRGAEVWGVDLDKNAINFAKKYLKLENVYAMSCDEFFKLPNLPKFDMITFFELLEHLDNPLEFIQSVKNLLKEDGTIVMSTPSRERILANLWQSDFPPHHLTRWNEKAISNLFKKINFKIMYLTYTDQLKFLLESLNSKLRTGLVLKTAKVFKSQKLENKEKEIVGGNFLTRIVHLGASFKDYFITGIPAIFLLIISKFLKYKNGDMLIYLKKHE